MKVLMLNGSPRKEGCTYTALCQIAETLKENGIESEIFQAGNADIENVRAAAKKMTEEIGAAMTVKEDIQYFTVEIVFSEKE